MPLEITKQFADLPVGLLICPPAAKGQGRLCQVCPEDLFAPAFEKREKDTGPLAAKTVKSTLSRMVINSGKPIGASA